MTPRELRNTWERLNRCADFLADLTRDLEIGGLRGAVSMRLRLLDQRIGRLAHDLQDHAARDYERTHPCDRRSSSSSLRRVS